MPTELVSFDKHRRKSIRKNINWTSKSSKLPHVFHSTKHNASIIKKILIVLYFKQKVRICFTSGLFIIMSIIIGILTVYLTSSKPKEICKLMYKQTIGNNKTYNSQPQSVAIGYFNNDTQLDFVVANTGIDNIDVFLGCGNGTFENQTTYSTGYRSRPYSVAVGDFNNDNSSDIVVGNYGTNSIGIFFGFNNGNFTIQKSFSTGSSRPLFIAVADINSDNQLDIAVVNFGTNSISLFHGFPNGSFLLSMTCFTGYDSSPNSLSIIDLNRDNQLDIVVANNGTDNIGIFFGNGNGSFRNQKLFYTGVGSGPSSVVIGDINNDNHLDIIVANNGTSNIGIFFGYGNETFSMQVTYSTEFGSRPQYLSIGNFNTDDLLDIIVVDSTNEYVYILPGHDNGTFPMVIMHSTGFRSAPYSVAVGDFNNDNSSDALVVNRGTNSLLVLVGYHVTRSVSYTTYSTGILSGPTSISIGDLNNDSSMDLVVANARGDTLGVFLGFKDGTFSSITTYSTGNGSTPYSIVLDDFNNDQKLDIAVVNYRQDNLGIFLGYNNGTFSLISTYSTEIHSSPHSLAVGNLNNDNCLDIAVVNEGTDCIGIFLGYCNGTFDTISTFPIGSGSDPYSIALGDLDKDNRLDIVVCNYKTSDIGIFFGNGDGTFLAIVKYSTGPSSAPYFVIINDFNNDNQLDIALALSFDSSVGIFYGYGNGSFGDIKTYYLPSSLYPVSLTAGDFNNDNLLDIGVSSYLTNEIVVLYGNNNSDFSVQESYSTNTDSNPYSIKFGDFNNDKLLDIAVANFGGNNVGIFISYYQAYFTIEQNYSTGSGPQPASVAVGDFNNDSKLDIAAVNFGNDNVGVRLGYGNGTFGIETTFSVGLGSSPLCVSLGDFNRDNQLDMVIAATNDDSITVFFGYNNGTFENPISYSTGFHSSPRSIASSDFNGDKWLDLVVANYESGEIVLLYGFNYATFDLEQTYFTGNLSQPISVCVADFNNDKQLDVALADYINNSISIFFGYGNGTVTVPRIYSTGIPSGPMFVSFGDFNNDHCQDIVVTNYDSNSIGLFFGYCNGTFAIMENYSTGNNSGPKSLAVGDVNNDNQSDIIVVNNNAGNLGVFLGNGKGNFSEMFTYSSGLKSDLFSIVLGDVNNDNYLDIIVTDVAYDNVDVFIGYGNGSFVFLNRQPVGLGCHPYSAVLGDFNNDNKLDIAVACRDTFNVFILFGYGNGNFSMEEEYFTGIGSHPYFMVTGYINEDNQIDIAVLCSGNNAFVIFFGLGDGQFLMGKKYSTDQVTLPVSMAIGNFNNDSHVDIVVANYLARTINIILGNGTEYFATKMTISTVLDSEPWSVAVGDFDNDNRSDIAVANYGTNNIGIIFSNENMTFSNLVLYSTGDGSRPSAVVVHDINGDNHLDIAVVNTGTDTVMIFRGYGNGQFILNGTYSTGIGSLPVAIAISDFNNDKRMDMAVANLGTNNVVILFGLVDDTFGKKTSYSTGYNSRPTSLAIGDFNEDKWIDIAVANFGTDHVEILLETC